MKKQEFYNLAMEIGVTMGEAFWLEIIYSKDDEKVTVDDNHMLMDCLAPVDVDSTDLINLCEKYAFLVNQAKKAGTYEEEQDYVMQF
ncbi:hypothetical protein AB1K32_25430 [Metabacillus dongyingensis]|uniref:hypothetical protein n=1 Tax=Metabacillus dongyingensis TaxID=2874282 RepID=UPI003B8BEC64